MCCIKQKDWLCEDQRWTEDGQAWFYVLKVENELNTRLDWLVIRNFFSRSDISSNFSVLVPSAELPPKGKNCKFFITPIFQFHRQRSACRCAKNLHCSQYQTTLTFTATRLLICKRKVLNVLLFLFKMHTLKIIARFVTRSFPNSPGARFSKVPIINEPLKLLLFTCKVKVSIVLHLTW